jgi:hypothetical protein
MLSLRRSPYSNSITLFVDNKYSGLISSSIQEVFADTYGCLRVGFKDGTILYVDRLDKLELGLKDALEQVSSYIN